MEMGKGEGSCSCVVRGGGGAVVVAGKGSARVCGGLRNGVVTAVGEVGGGCGDGGGVEVMMAGR